MVTADKGHCLIDEFDKMSDADRTSIHEAMEQQTISIAKAGIVTTLQARCAIIAAANPVTGQYDSSQTFEQQVNLTQPILSRFDLLFAVRDNVNTRTDTQLAKFIINSHIRNWSTGISPESHPLIPEEMFREEAQLLPGVTDVTADTDLESTNPLPQEWLRKYILYARGNCNPRIEQINFAKIERLYAKLRGDSAMKYESGVKIVVRHLESMLRLSEAFARMRLGDYVRDDDVNRAISLFLNCFLQTLPHKRSQEMKKRYMDFLVLEKQHNDVIIHVLGTLTEQERRARQYHKDFAYDTIEIQYDELLQAAEQYKIYDRDIAKFVKNDMRLHDQYTIITKSGAPEPIDHEDIKAFRWSPNKTSG